MKKYYKYIILSLIAILLVCVFLLIKLSLDNKSNNSNNTSNQITENDIIFRLIGDTETIITVGEEYQEAGYVANTKDGHNLKDNILVLGEVDSSREGIYQIKYFLVYRDIRKELIRTITVKNENVPATPGQSEKPPIAEEDSKNIELSLIGQTEKYILKNTSYIEEGVKAIDKIDGDISSKVKINGVVNANQIGEYKLIYTVTNSRMQTETIERKVIVYDYNYNFNVSEKNSALVVNFRADSDVVRYISVSGVTHTVSGNSLTFTLDRDRLYKITLYDKYGNIKEENLDYTKPFVTCQATISLNNTSINVQTDKNDIIKYIYYYGSQKKESNMATYSIAGNYTSISVEAYRSNSISNKATCKVIDNTPLFESGMKSSVYSNWNYYLYVPNNVRKSEKRPLVIFLHGSGERGNNITALNSYGFAKYIKNGENYNSFILIPQLPSGKTWADNVSTLMNLIKKIVSEYNIDEDRISISGFSLGAIGLTNVIKENQNYFSCAVLIALGGRGSSYATYFKNIPTRIYAGSNDTSLGNSSTTKEFVNALKKINSNVEFTVYNNKPHNVVDLVLKDGTVLNWMISQKK